MQNHLKEAPPVTTRACLTLSFCLDLKPGLKILKAFPRRYVDSPEAHSRPHRRSNIYQLFLSKLLESMFCYALIVTAWVFSSCSSVYYSSRWCKHLVNIFIKQIHLSISCISVIRLCLRIILFNLFTCCTLSLTQVTRAQHWTLEVWSCNVTCCAIVPPLLHVLLQYTLTIQFIRNTHTPAHSHAVIMWQHCNAKSYRYHLGQKFRSENFF